MNSTTIVAPATPTGVSALAVIRVSGPEVRQIAELMLSCGLPAPKQMIRAQAIHPHSKVHLDDLMVVYFPGPRSYTGEDVLELFPHGNPILVRHIVDAIRCIPSIRMAEPGEFTRRAFEAGKLDLIQAEAIGQLLHATVDSSLQNAQKLLHGKLSAQIHSLTDSVRHISAMLELEVDFAEEEADPDQKTWIEQLYGIQGQITQLSKGFRSQTAANRTPTVVFYGAPNAGKSSLVNALLEDDRLLVSPRAGTTRDVVEVLLLLEGGEVRLVDTAGLSENPVDELDAASQDKARKHIDASDLAVLLVDASSVVDIPSNQRIRDAREQGHWVLWTKADAVSEIPMQRNEGEALVSSHNRQGLESFLANLSTRLFPPEQATEEFWITSERQQEALLSAQAGIERALRYFQAGRSAPEELAFELAFVRRALEGITGQISTDQILNVIFSSFCIGK